MSFNKKFHTIIAFITAVCFGSNVYASSVAVSSLYNYASNGNTSKIRYMVQNLGYDIDTQDDDGKSAYCIAKENNDIKVMTILERMGANPEQKCSGISWGVIGGVIGIAAVGGGIAAAAGGGGGGSDSGDSKQDLCQNITCGQNQQCVQGVCICDNGFVENAGECYADLNCNNLTNSDGQFKDSCHCINGFEGPLCDTCSGDVQNGVCYPKIRCSHGGVQIGNTCDCSSTGYSGEYCEVCNGYDNGTTCFPKITCANGGKQYEDICVCANGYSGNTCETCDGFEKDGVCHKSLDCNVNGGKQDGSKCDCYEGYTGFNCSLCSQGYDHYGSDLTKCYQTLSCGEHGRQEENACVCDDGYKGASCDSCDDGYDHYGSDECYPSLACGEHGHQEENTCVCDTGYERDGMGMCVEISLKTTAKIILNNNDNYMPMSEEGGVQVEYADLYGKIYDKSTPADTMINSDNLYLNVLNNDEYTDTIDNIRSLYLNQLSDGSVYGIKSDNADNIYITYLKLGEAVGLGNQTTTISINNGGKILGSEIFTSGGNGDAFGIYSLDGNIYNMAQDITAGVNNKVSLYSEINITSLRSGSTYGMYSVNGNINNGLYDINTGENFVNENAKIIVSGMGTGNVFGLYSAGNGTIINSGNVTTSSKKGVAMGIYASGNGNITNLGDITVLGEENAVEVYGIYSNGGNVTNSGNVTVNTSGATTKAYGIYANGGSVINSGTINIMGDTSDKYGIYATNGATVINNKDIVINGNKCLNCDGSTTFENYIVLDGGALLTNFGLMSYEGLLDFDSYNGGMELGKNGVYRAESIKGTLNVDSSVVEKGFADKYVEASSLKGTDIDVKAVSKSVMFEASVEKDAGKDSSSVVLNRKSFEELLGTSSVSKYLETNYKAGNDEALYSNLKKQTSLTTFANTVAEELGYGLLPNFAQENMRVFRSLSNTLNEELFETSGKERSMVGYDYLYQERETKGTLTGYENHSNTMYFMYDRELDSLFRSGFGMSITQFSSDYEDDSSRDELMVQGIIPISYVQERGINYASTIRVGYGDGEYERRLSDDKYESDLTSWLYGISNAVRYKLDLGFVELEPTVELNVMGYYQDKIEETEGKRGAISTDAENNLSVEAGVGLNVKKAIKFGPKSNIKLKAGAMYYHEYANPYHSLEARQVRMNDSYLIRDEENIYEKDRGVISAGIDYEYKPFTIYGNYRHFIEDKNPFEINAGLKFNF